MSESRLSLEERLLALEKKVSILERDLREHWHDITTLQLKDKKGDKTVQVLLPSATKPEETT
jgi:hypothetical protein